MATKIEQMQRFARYYREQIGKDVTMLEVAQAAQKAGWKMPKPKSPVELLAKEFARAEREEIFYDEVTGEPYRANICYTQTTGNQQVNLWGDIDKAPRNKMVKNVALRREQMVGDGLQLTFDVRHWNRINPDEDPIQLELDFTDDIEWRMNAPKDKRKAA